MRHPLVEFHLPFFSGHRRIRVFLPPKMESPTPLLVLLDGQNVFDDLGSHSGGWHADLAVSRLPSTVARPLVVAVDHGHQHRMHELWSGLEHFQSFVTTEVVPTVAARWPLTAHRAIGGSSMGGLAALAIHFRNPDLFAGALCMSPSFWVQHGRIFDELRSLPVPRLSKIYLDAGGKERLAPLAAKMAYELTQRGYGPDRLMWRPDARGRHHERHWQRRLPKALRFLFHK